MRFSERFFSRRSRRKNRGHRASGTEDPPWSLLIAAGVLTAFVVLQPILIVGVLVLAVIAYGLILHDLGEHPVETDVVLARRSMGRNVPRSWDSEQGDAARQVELERGSVTVGLHLRGPQFFFSRSRWARRRK